MLSLTQLCDGNWVLLWGFLLYGKRQGLILPFLLSFLLAGFLVQLLKAIWESPRPAILFEGQLLLCLPGIKHITKSFPSGHAANAFVLASFLAQRSSRMRQYTAYSLAALMALSRVYVGAHFLSDIWIGSWIGFLASQAVFSHYRHHLPQVNYYLRGFLVSLLGILASLYYLFLHHEVVPKVGDYFKLAAWFFLLWFSLRSVYYLCQSLFDLKLKRLIHP